MTSLPRIFLTLSMKIVIMHPDVKRALLLSAQVFDRLISQFLRIPITPLVVNKCLEAFEHDRLVALHHLLPEPFFRLRTGDSCCRWPFEANSSAIVGTLSSKIASP